MEILTYKYIVEIKNATEFVKRNHHITLTPSHINQWEKLKNIRDLIHNEFSSDSLVMLFFKTAEEYFEALEDNSYNFSDDDFQNEWGSRIVGIDF